MNAKNEFQQLVAMQTGRERWMRMVKCPNAYHTHSLKSDFISAMDVTESERPSRIVKSTQVRDKREKRKALRKNRSSTTFKSKPTRSSNRKR